MLTCFVVLLLMCVESIDLAISGDHTQKQSDGHWFCLVCTHRIRPKQRSRPYGGNAGRAHISCIQVLSRSYQKVTGLKRSPLSGPSDSISPPVTRLRTRSPFEEYGYIRVKGNDTSRQLAWEAVQISRRASRHSSVIAGNVRQFDLSLMDDLRDFLTRWSNLLKEVAESVGINTTNMFVVDPKLLVAPPKHGQQAVHWDGPRHHTSAVKFTGILYCSNGSMSTALPRFPANDTLSFSDIPSEMASVSHLLDSSQYDSQPVHPGDLVFFQHSIPHFGVRNICEQGDRVVLFGILSSSDASMQDAVQVFPWLYIGAAFGWDSIEFAKALVEYKAYSPVQRIQRDEGDSEKEVCLGCLRRWKLFTSYHS